MVAIVWTHPKHPQLAGLGTVLNAMALILVIAALDVTPAFRNKRTDYIFGWQGGNMATLLQMVIDCTNDVCTEKTTSAGWQKAAIGLVVTGFAVNLLTFVLQLLVFWPMAVYVKLLSILLQICQLLDMIGAYTKFFGGMVMAFHISDININFASAADERTYEMRSLPIGIIHASFLLEVLAVLLYRLALDPGPRGGLSHLERLKNEYIEAKMLDMERREQRQMKRRRSSYIPKPGDTHGNVHPQQQE